MSVHSAAGPVLRRAARPLLDVAAAVLVADPAASLAEVAEAAGIGRTTLHKHYATRDDLVRAVGHRAIDLWEQADRHGDRRGRRAAGADRRDDPQRPAAGLPVADPGLRPRRRDQGPLGGGGGTLPGGAQAGPGARCAVRLGGGLVAAPDLLRPDLHRRRVGPGLAGPPGRPGPGAEHLPARHRPIRHSSTARSKRSSKTRSDHEPDRAGGRVRHPAVHRAGPDRLGRVRAAGPDGAAAHAPGPGRPVRDLRPDPGRARHADADPAGQLGHAQPPGVQPGAAGPPLRGPADRRGAQPGYRRLGAVVPGAESAGPHPPAAAGDARVQPEGGGNLPRTGRADRRPHAGPGRRQPASSTWCRSSPRRCRSR